MSVKLPKEGVLKSAIMRLGVSIVLAWKDITCLQTIVHVMVSIVWRTQGLCNMYLISV